MAKKRIRVGYSTLTERFFAFDHYKSKVVNGREIITVTGEKYDVTQDIAGAVVEHNIEFSEAPDEGRGSEESNG